jgi:hypothetical protein
MSDNNINSKTYDELLQLIDKSNNDEQDYNNFNKKETGLFDIQKFNKEFEERHKADMEKAKLLNYNKLNQLENENQIIELQPYEKSIYENLIGIKNTIVNMSIDIYHLNFSSDFLTKENRLYYLGIIILIIVLLIYSFIKLFSDDDKDCTIELSELEKIRPLCSAYHNCPYNTHQPDYHNHINKINSSKTTFKTSADNLPDTSKLNDVQNDLENDVYNNVQDNVQDNEGTSDLKYNTIYKDKIIDVEKEEQNGGNIGKCNLM